VGAEAGGNRVDNNGKSKVLSPPNLTELVGALTLGGRALKSQSRRCSCCRKPLR
jgi:hypothetical protein